MNENIKFKFYSYLVLLKQLNCNNYDKEMISTVSMLSNFYEKILKEENIDILGLNICILNLEIKTINNNMNELYPILTALEELYEEIKKSINNKKF